MARSNAAAAALECVAAIGEVVRLQANWRNRRAILCHNGPDFNDGSTEKFKTAIDQLKKAAAILGDAYPAMSKPIKAMRAQRGPCALCRTSGQTAHEVAHHLAERILGLVGSLTCGPGAMTADTNVITPESLPKCYECVGAIGLDHAELEQLRCEVEWELPRRVKRPAVTAEEANPRVRDALRCRPPNGKKWTVRRMAKAIGCSTGLLNRLPAWRAYRLEQRNKEKAPAPKAVGLTEVVLANEGQEDPSLAMLIAEQDKDAKAEERQYRHRKTV
jgi:hypothetical protein